MIEIWKPIIGREGEYEVSNLGHVRGMDRLVWHNTKHNDRPRKVRGCWLKPQLSKTGYYIVCFNKNSKKTFRQVHRLVAEAFIPNPDNKPIINHKNGVKTDNRAENLEWCTYLENHHHARDILKHTPGRPPKSVRCIETELRYPSIHAAGNQTGINFKNIHRALKHQRTAGGYHWEYAT